MKNTIEITYTKKHTVSLSENALDYIAQAIYGAFTRELSNHINDGVAGSIPGNTLKEIFNRIVTDMKEDDKFWED